MTRQQKASAQIAASRLRLALPEYLSFLESGMKHCWSCQLWHPLENFGADRSRPDGLASSCKQSRREQEWLRYRPKISRRRNSRVSCCCCDCSVDSVPPVICADCIEDLQEVQKAEEIVLASARGSARSKKNRNKKRSASIRRGSFPQY